MLDLAAKDVRDRLHPPMRMPREAGAVLGGAVGAEVVEEQKWVVLFGRAEADRAMQVDAGPLDAWAATGRRA